MGSTSDKRKLRYGDKVRFTYSGKIGLTEQVGRETRFVEETATAGDEGIFLTYTPKHEGERWCLIGVVRNESKLLAPVPVSWIEPVEGR